MREEDFVQRRPADLEVLDRGLRHQPLQQRLRLARVAQLVQAGLFDAQLDPGQPRQGRAPPATRTRMTSWPWAAWISARVPSSTLRPLKIMKMRSHICSAVAMSWVREDDRACRPRCSVEDGVAEHLGVDRIEAGERLVEDDQLGLGDHRGDELHLLRHALGQRLDGLVGPVAQAHAFAASRRRWPMRARSAP